MVNCPYSDQCRDNDTAACAACDNLVEKPSYYRPRRYRGPSYPYWPYWPSDIWITSGNTWATSSPSVSTQTFYVSRNNSTCSTKSCSCNGSEQHETANGPSE